MKRYVAVIFGLALTSSAQAIVIDNGIPEGTVGHFSADVQSGGAVSRVLFTTRRFDSPEIVTVSLVSQYQVYVDPGDVGGGFLLSEEDFLSGNRNIVDSSGDFEGENGPIEWFATSTIKPGTSQLSTFYSFSTPFNDDPTDAPDIGALRVYQYLDGDMSDGSDVLRVKNTDEILELRTLGNTNLFGVAQLYDTTPTGFDSDNPVFAGGAVDIFDRIVPRISDAGQAVAPDILVAIANLPSFVHPELGTVRGPGDIVSVLAFDWAPKNNDLMIVETFLTAVLPPPDPNPPRDSDHDGVPNPSDRCPVTPAGTPVQPNGCPFPDADGDGVIDANDDCSQTPVGTPVQANGCPVPDFDSDGVPDSADNCIVVSNPTQVDIDGDGAGDVCDVTNPVPSIVNRRNVPCRGKKCDVKLACPTRPNSTCKNSAVITVDRKFLRAPPSSSRVSLSNRAPRRTVQMAAGATSVPPGAVGIIRMNLNKKGLQVIGVNRGNTIPGKMSIFNSAGERLSATKIMMRITNSPSGDISR